VCSGREQRQVHAFVHTHSPSPDSLAQKDLSAQTGGTPAAQSPVRSPLPSFVLASAEGAGLR
jgi:hypothetical protein